jgi:hypothetical protein
MGVTRRELIVGTAAAIAALPCVGQAPPPVAAEEGQAWAPVVHARYNWILNKWGAHLTAEQRADIRRMLADNEKGLAAMRAYPLENGNDPATPFRLYRKESR